MKITKKIIIVIFVACSSLIYGQTNSELLKRQAIENMQAGSYEKAIDRLKNYISINPYDPDGYSLRGLCYERLYNLEDAVHDFKRARKIDSTDSEVARNLERVESLWKNSVYKIIDRYKSRINESPELAENYLKIADNYVLLENFQLAEKWYDEYLKRDHNSTPEEILKYTEVFAKNNSIEKGEKLLSVYVFKYPNDWRLFTRLGYFKLWSAKNDEAKEAFLTALELKPFNKEAEEGLKLAESFVDFSVKDIQYIPDSYLIENYERTLLRDPNRDDIRFNLAEQLVRAGLFEESYSHLKYLGPNYEGSSRFDDLMELTIDGREDYYERLIDSYQDKLSDNPNDKESLLKLVELSNSLKNYGDSEDALEDYLEINPNSDEIIYLYAKTLSYDTQYSEALSHIEKAISLNPSNIDYKILAAKLIVFEEDNKNYGYAHKLLDDALRKSPRNIDALTFLGRLNFLEGNFSTAKTNAMFAAQIDPSNPDLISLLMELKDKFPDEKVTKLPVKIIDEDKPMPPQISNLEIGRNLALESKCNDAIDYYLDYIDEHSANKDLLLELAEVYNCAGEYGEAIEVYDFLLERRDDYQIKKLKAKSYYLDGDYSKTIDILSELSVNHLDDYELQTLLADAYASDDEYDFARDTYNLIEQNAPEYYLVSQRKDWLPTPEIDIEPDDIDDSPGIFANHFLAYVDFYPEFTYYRDNTGFDFSTVGTGGEISLAENIAVGGNVHRGSVANDFGRLNYMSYLGNIIYRPSPNWKLTAGYGKITSTNSFDQPLYEASVRYQGSTRYSHYSAGLKYKYTDAATLMESEGLVFTRLATHHGNLTGHYRFRKGLNVYGNYKIYLFESTNVFNQNIGNSIDVKIAKEFYDDFMAGYEYYFSDYKYKVPTYYSPQKFDSHSFWADWDIHTDIEWDINLAGRLGYVPDEDHIIREISAKAIYKGFENLSITASGFAGETSRSFRTYKSYSFFLTATWNFIK